MFSDRNMFELLVVLTAQFRSRACKDTAPMMAADKSLMVSLSSRFAMTPADRSRVTVDKPKDSKLDAFMKRRKETSAPPVEPPAEENSLIN
jgi:hypothetical protein